MKTLTEHQIFVIKTLEYRGCNWIAQSIRTSWEKGEYAYIDDRATKAQKGMIRHMHKGNAQAHKGNAQALTNS
jgi:hypothetical protein